jgi:hypothetical protein
MARKARARNRRVLLEAKLTELAALARHLYPSATVEASTLSYEGEDGRVVVFAPPDIADAEIEQIEAALNDRAFAIYEETGFYIPCAVLDLITR